MSKVGCIGIDPNLSLTMKKRDGQSSDEDYEYHEYKTFHPVQHDKTVIVEGLEWTCAFRQ